MAALDFPNSPTNGTQYSAPNGALYTFDGAAWTVSGVISTGTAAGGDLTGTYPNPTVKNLAITLAKLAVGASLRQVIRTAYPASYLNNPTGTFAAVQSVAITTSGGIVLLIAMGGWHALTSTVNTAHNISLGWGRDQQAPNTVTVDHAIEVQGAGTWNIPLGPVIAADQPPAGSHTYYLSAICSSSNVYLQTLSSGNASASYIVEFA